MTRHSILNRRLRIEPLERRQLLCSGMTGSSSLQAASQLAAFAGSHTASLTSNSVKKNSTSGSSDSTTESHLFATLTDSGGTIVGTASLETDTSSSGTVSQKLVIAVVGAAASASYDVTAGGTDLGTLTTDVNGNGRLVLTTSGSSSSSSAVSAACSGNSNGTTTTGTLPTDFTLAAGATIALTPSDTTLDTLNGTFATSTGDIGEGNGFGGQHGGCHGGQNTSVSRLEATLSNGTTTVGRAVFSEYTNSDGTTTDILRVHLKGADASTTLDVSVDGTSVGSITTDANGNGILILSSNPKSSNVGQLPTGFTVTSDSTITVGTTVTGSFGTSSASSGSATFGSLVSASHHSRRR
jgi:hypothetical protein